MRRPRAAGVRRDTPIVRCYRPITPPSARTLAGIDRASATREWTGAWPLIRTVVDLLAAEQADDLGVADLQRGAARTSTACG